MAKWGKRGKQGIFRVKIPKKMRPPLVTLPKDVIRQNRFRKTLENIKKRAGLFSTKEIGTGVDYFFYQGYGKNRQKIKIDFKFGFGALGENVIKVRIAERKLINKSNLVMAVDSSGKIHIFPTKALSEYVRRCWGRISKKHFINKGAYTEYPISLADLYLQTGIRPATVKMKEQAIKEGLENVIRENFPVPEQSFVPRESAPFFRTNIKQQFQTTQHTLDRRQLVRENYKGTMNRGR
ncbi:MAG: hypothetical protein NTY48_07455 [Candidatus Diapherotrites archaeon]|nr:hypothetical protein [Candidatus Diapherotrites archaeon]